MSYTPKRKDSAKQTIRRSANAVLPSAECDTMRPVFAAYFNMARANLYNVLRYISVQCGLEVNHDEDSMHELPVARFAGNKRPEVRQKAFMLLMRHIPMLQQMTQASLTQGRPADGDRPEVARHLTVEQEDVQRMLQNLIRVVNFQRNRFTHAKPYDTEEEQRNEASREKALYRPLQTALKGSKQEVKRLFCYTAEVMDFIDQEEHMKRIPMKDSSGRVLLDERGRELFFFVEQSDWYFRLYDTKPDPVTGIPKPECLSTAGLLFLLCRLLHKRYATQLSQQVGLFRTREHNGSSPFRKEENEVMFNIFCDHRIRLPRGRVESTAADSALGLDMLNELQKCPAELFDTLSPADRKLFQIKRKDDEAVPDADDDINLFRRCGDRFPLLALRYIDAMRGTKAAVLNDMVFQIALGKFRHKFYNRASLDTTEADRLRVPQKEINGFGPIDKVEAKRKMQYASLLRTVSDDPDHLYDPDTADTKPYLTDHHASYAITGDRIGITWNAVVQNPKSGDKRTSLRLKWNDTAMERLDGDRCYLPTLPSPAANIAPRAWLSLHDLPALIFLHLLGGDPEAVIRETHGNLVRLMDDIGSGRLMPSHGKAELETLLAEDYGLRLCDVPKKLVGYLTGRAPQSENKAEAEFIRWVNLQLDGDEYTDGIIGKLQERIKQFDQDLKTVGDKQNRLGRKGYVDVRPGSLARYIAKDIMDMTRPDTTRKNNGKPSGLDFGVLQSSIATFKAFGEPLEATPLGKMLHQAINVANHPFLGEVMRQRIADTVDLYRRYQQAKLNYLKQLRNGTRGRYRDQWFLREAWRNHTAGTAANIQGAEGLAARYIDTLQLPNGLFNNAIRQRLATVDNAALKAALDDEGKAGGVSHLINAWFVNTQADDSQPFYRDLKRHYKVLDWALFRQDPQHIVDILPTLVPPELYLADSEIAALLRKGDADEAPVLTAINHMANRLQRKVGFKTTFVKGRELRVPDYGKEGSAYDKDKDELFAKLMGQLRHLQRNERDIRRHHNQDMLLFLMAKRLLLSGGVVFGGKAKVERGVDQFRLHDILPPAMPREGNKSILEQPVDFQLTIGLTDAGGKPILDGDGRQITRTVGQQGIKLKNYGDFYTFLYDSRIGSLLAQLPESGTVERGDLEAELDHYDRQRRKVFALLQAIEKRIIDENPQLADSNADGPGFCNADGTAYRNNFRSLLSLCRQYVDEGGCLTDVSELLVGIRNAFSHNYYVISTAEPLDLSRTALPQVADSILKWLEEHTVDGSR